MRNGASFAVYAVGAVAFSGAITAGDVVTIKITGLTNNISTENDYTYTILASDTLDTVMAALADKIDSSNNGAGDPFVIATANNAGLAVDLTAKQQGPDGDNVSFTVVTSTNATILPSTSGTSLTGGADASQIAPGTLISIFPNPNTVLSYAPAQAADLSQKLPNELGGVQVYINGFLAPLLYVSPAQINAQIPWEMDASTSVNIYARMMTPDGSVVATTAVAVPIIPANPGLFTYSSSLPEAPVVAQHASSHAMGIVSVDGSVSPGDGGVIEIRGRRYSHTVVDTDTLVTIENAFIDQINAHDPEVYAAASGQFTRIMLFARISGPAGNGIPYTAGVTVAPTVTGGALVLTGFSASLCCANLAGSLVTQTNPAQTDEFINVYATGIGEPPYSAQTAGIYRTGVPFPADSPTTAPAQSVSSAVSRVTADVLEATPMPGSVGVFRVLLHINAGLGSDPLTTLTIAQNGILSNVTTLPVVSPSLPAPQQ